jgi:hypothetical protein
MCELIILPTIYMCKYICSQLINRYFQLLLFEEIGKLNITFLGILKFHEFVGAMNVPKTLFVTTL